MARPRYHSGRVFRMGAQASRLLARLAGRPRVFDVRCDFHAPPGLWAAISIVGLEFLRRREPTSRDMPFLVEWAMVGGVLVAMAVLFRATLAIFMIDLTSLGLVLLEQLSTLAAYPLVVLLSSKVLSVTKLTPTEADELMRQS